MLARFAGAVFALLLAAPFAPGPRRSHHPAPEVTRGRAVSSALVTTERRLLDAGAGAGGSRPRAETTQSRAPLFEEDFEEGLAAWAFPLGSGHEVVAAGVERGNALALETRALPVYALIRGSEEWRDVRIEGTVLFPDTADAYLGFIYRYREDTRRIDFGGVYIKGNDDYVQANPRFDTNVGRTLHPELRVALRGEQRIRIGEWQRFALEVVGPEAHLYVGTFDTPVITVALGSAERGAFGFEPRNPGASVWIDDLRVTEIERFQYRGPPRPDPAYDQAEWLRSWHVLGPLTRHARAVEERPFSRSAAVSDDGRVVRWTPFETDARGAVASGRVTEHRGGRRVAYFHAPVEAVEAGAAVLEVASADDLAIWLNGGFLGFAARQPAAWWDAGSNTAHAPIRARVTLREGTNDLVVRVTGGVYATGGFFVRVRR